MNIYEVADEASMLARQTAEMAGMTAVTVIIDADGAFQLRAPSALNTNVLVGVMQRAVVHLVLGMKSPKPVEEPELKAEEVS